MGPASRGRSLGGLLASPSPAPYMPKFTLDDSYKMCEKFWTVPAEHPKGEREGMVSALACANNNTNIFR